MQMAFVGVFDPAELGSSGADPAAVFRRFKDVLAARLHLVPRFRQRVIDVPFGLDNPYFVDDPDFDLDRHVGRLALPSPGGQAELEDLIGRMVSRPLDATRPLWDLVCVEGLADGRWAYVGRAHHVLVDGVGGNDILLQLLDLTPEPRDVPPPDEPFDPAPIPSPAAVLRHAAAGQARWPSRVAGTVKRTAEVAYDVARWSLSRPEDHGHLRVLGPRTFLNGPVGPDRQVAFGRLPLERVKAVKNEVGCTVNDVVLAITGLGLRAFLAEHGEEPDKGLVAAVPISIRKADDPAGGNQVSGMTVPLFDDVADARAQLEAVARATRPAKEQLGAVAAAVLTDWSEHAVPAVAAQAFRFYSRMGLARRHPPIANVTLSNVPGPPVPLYLAGSRLEAMFPIGPVIHNQRCNLTVVSYLDTMFLGAVADASHVPPIAGLVGHLEDAVKHLADELGV